MISVITPCYCRLEYTTRCIDAIRRYNPDADYEHILVDNGSWDGTKEWFHSLKALDTGWWNHITYIRLNENIGDHAAKAIGLKEAKGEYIHMVDNDIALKSFNYLTMIKELYDYLVDNENWVACRVRGLGCELLFRWSIHMM